MFAATSPITKFEEDLFGYSDFARTIAKGISERQNIYEPYVIGIDARWGSGKTSAAHLIAAALADLSAEYPSDQRRVHVINFPDYPDISALGLTSAMVR